MTDRKPRILFLCTGNSCRSQMAEGFANFLGRDYLEARSAGIEAHGKNPNAVAIMREAGVDISGQESKLLTLDLLNWADIVVTVHGHAEQATRLRLSWRNFWARRWRRCSCVG